VIYEVEITETLQRVVEIEADSKDEAVEKVCKQYSDEKIVLDESDFKGNEITIYEEKTQCILCKKDNVYAMEICPDCKTKINEGNVMVLD